MNPKMKMGHLDQPKPNLISIYTPKVGWAMGIQPKPASGDFSI